MTLENFHNQAGIMPKQLIDRFTENPGPVHEQPMYYPYEAAPQPQGHIVSIPSKHHFGGGSLKNNAAMSALTLLAFLFFLHILQQCLREHMTALNTPQVMIMTGGKEGEESIARISNKKLDKTGVPETGENQNALKPESSNDDNEKYFMKITSSEYSPWKNSQNKQKFKADTDPSFQDFVRTVN